MYMQMYAQRFNMACPVGKVGSFAQNSYYLALQATNGVVVPTAQGLLVPAGILTDNPWSDEPKIFFCPVDTSRELNEPTSSGGAPFMQSTTRSTYMQNPTWRWGDAGATGVNPNNNPSFCIGYYDWDSGTDFLSPSAGGRRPWLVPKVRNFRGHGLVADELIQDTFLKQAHRDGMNVLYSNWSAQFVPLAMFKPEWDQLVAASPGGAYTAAASPFVYAIWKKLGQIGD
jgi:hypothetical protein